MGRPSKLTPEVQKKIVDAIKLGSYAEVAAALAGVHPGTYYRWMQLGEAASSGKYYEFRESVKEANAFSEAYAIAMVRKAMPENWQAAMTYLERRFPDRWTRMQRLEHTGAQGKDLFDASALAAHPAVAPLPPDDRRRIAAGLRKLLPMLAAVGGEDDEEVEAEGEVIEVSAAEGTP